MIEPAVDNPMVVIGVTKLFLMPTTAFSDLSPLKNPFCQRVRNDNETRSLHNECKIHWFSLWETYFINTFRYIRIVPKRSGFVNK